jgi:hypothetical protein
MKLLDFQFLGLGVSYMGLHKGTSSPASPALRSNRCGLRRNLLERYTRQPRNGDSPTSCVRFLTSHRCERMFVMMGSGSDNLNEERLANIERGARERHTLLDRVVLELVEEVRRLRGTIAGMEEQ